VGDDEMNQLSTEKRTRVIAALVEGNSIRATVRMTGVAKNTVTKLLRDIGTACSKYQDRTLRNLPCKRLQLDEIWSFVYAKSRNVPESKLCEPHVGSVWTWVALDADTKLVPTYLIGGRDAGTATAFVRDLASRLANRVQLTSDGLAAYVNAVDDAFGQDIDFAMLIKMYGPDGNPRKPESKYSPGKCNGSKKHKMTGNPDREHVATSYVERQNLTMRMSMRRFTRLTNAFSKKAENLAHAVSLHFMHYNFCRKHQTLGMTPAQAAGVTDHQWTLEELVGLLDSN
jgi:IS1 family transposase